MQQPALQHNEFGDVQNVRQTIWLDAAKQIPLLSYSHYLIIKGPV